MRLKLKKEDLNKGLQAVQKVAQNKSNNISSENGLLIKALHGIIEFQANDYDMGIKITVPGIIEEGGEAFIANPYLMELTRRLPSDEIEIIKEDADTQLMIKGGKLKFECLTMNPDDFNEVEIVENGYASFTTTSVVMKDLIDNTSYACATDVARPIFMGTYLDVQGDQMTMVATDTHRLALKTATLDEPVDNPLQAVIPQPTVIRNFPPAADGYPGNGRNHGGPELPGRPVRQCLHPDAAHRRGVPKLSARHPE